MPVRWREDELPRAQFNLSPVASGYDKPSGDFDVAGGLGQQADSEDGLILLDVRVRVVPFRDRQFRGADMDPAHVVVGNEDRRGGFCPVIRADHRHALAVRFVDQVVDGRERELGAALAGP